MSEAPDAVSLAREVYRLCRGLVSGEVTGTAFVDAAGVHLHPGDRPAVVLATSGSASGTPKRVLIRWTPSAPLPRPRPNAWDAPAAG